jgi:sporulation protein YlmC with PRC-barrel domain
MEIPLKAQVACTDGVCGRCVYVLMNPVSDQVTHLVVRMDSLPHTEYMVPVDVVTATTADTIGLRCSKAELEKMDPFVDTHYLQEKMPDYAGSAAYGMGSYYYWPYVTPERTVSVPVETLQIPPGELAVRRGTRVEATDGFVGKVDEFLVNPETGHITHLVMREGHLWGQKDVTIPLSAMGETQDDTVFLKLDKHQIESLPTVPVHRRWF